MTAVLRCPAKHLFPDLLAFHAKIDKTIRVCLFQPSRHLSIHLHTNLFQIAELGISSRKQFSQKHFGFGETFLCNGFELRWVTKPSQTDPDDPLGIDLFEKLNDGFLIFSLPAFMADEWVKMKSQWIILFLTFSRGFNPHHQWS